MEPTEAYLSKFRRELEDGEEDPNEMSMQKSKRLSNQFSASKKDATMKNKTFGESVLKQRKDARLAE